MRDLPAALARTLRARALFHGPRRYAGARPERPERAGPSDLGPSDLGPAPGPRARAEAGDGRTWDELEAEALGCTLCGLCETRTQVVFGEGSRSAELLFVGEAPGFEEDRQGRPFVGRAGQLLTQMIRAMGFEREDVYIANVLKCRPPDNRDPGADEVERCRPYLLRQVELIRPAVICTLGRHALATLTGYDGPMGRARGRRREFHGTILVPTWHPAYLLRNPAAKREAWDDLKAVLAILGRPVPPPPRRRS